MPLATGDLIRVCEILAKEENLQITVTQSVKGGLIAGSGAFLGSLLMGPVGLAVGGTVGAVYAYARSEGKYKPLINVIKDDMSDRQKEELAQHVSQIVSNINSTDVVVILSILAGDPNLKSKLILTIGNYIYNEFGMALSN